MGNVLKKFALNKTTVTILGIIAGVAVLVIGYTVRTNTNTSLISAYYVTQTVGSNVQLNESMIKKTRINASLIDTNKDLVTDLSQIRDKNGEFFYVNYGHTLTEGSLITKSALIAKENKSDEKLYHNLKDGETIFKIDVDLDSTHAKAIQKGNAMDIYVEGSNNGEVIYTKFIENLKVIDVVDNQWATTKDKNSAESNGMSPRYLITAVNEEMFQLLSNITLVDGYSFKLVPEDTRKPFIENSEPTIVNTNIKNIIEAHTSYTN